MTTLPADGSPVRRQRSAAFALLPALLILSAGAVFASVSPVIGAGLVGCATLYLALIRRHQVVFAIVLLVLLLSDSRLPALDSMEVLRYPVMVVAGVFAVLQTTPIRLSKPVLWFLPFYFSSLVSTLNGDSGATGFLKPSAYLLLILVAFQFAPRLIQRDQKEVVRLILRFFVFAILGGLVLAVIAPSIALYTPGRLRGIFGNPDGLGLFGSLSLPLLVAMRDAKVVPRRGTALLIALVVLSIVLSGSRSALMAVVILFLMRYAVRARPVGRMLAIGAMAAVAFTGNAIMKSPEQLTGSPVAGVLRPQTLQSGSGRLFAWVYAMGYIRTAPLFGRGYGFDEFIFNDEHRETVFLDRGGHQGGIHNGYLGLILNTGVVGLALYLLFIGAVVASAPKISLLVPTLAVAMWTSMFEAYIVAPLNAYSILLMLSLVLIPLVNRPPKMRGRLVG